VTESGLQAIGPKRAIIIFDTNFGNTERIGKSISAGLQRAGVKVDIVSTREALPGPLQTYDLIVIGAPTQKFTASEPMKEFIGRLEKREGGLEGKSFFAFDTKLPSRFSGSAAKYIESRLEKMGLRAAAQRSSAIGRGSTFKLDEGEEVRFEGIGVELGRGIAGQSAKN